MTKTILSVIVIILGVAAFFLFQLTREVDVSQSPTPSPMPSSQDLSNFIRLEKPGPTELIKSPLNVSGEARGIWYFEASFPVKIYDADGKLLGVEPAQAQDEWMTEDFVPFQVLLEFEKPTTKTGYLVLEKDNPSGLPEYAAELRVPISFDLEGWQTGGTATGDCRITGCSSQICSDHDIITTCEFKPEYACYRTATCERQPDGQCGWTPSVELVQCLGEAFRAEEGEL